MEPLRPEIDVKLESFRLIFALKLAKSANISKQNIFSKILYVYHTTDAEIESVEKCKKSPQKIAIYAVNFCKQ